MAEPAEDSRVDRHRDGREALTREHLRQQTAGGVPHDHRLLVQGRDDFGRVIGDILQRLVGEDLGFGPGGFDRLRIVWPVRRQRDVPGLLEQLGPGIPARRQQPEPMDEDHRLRGGRIRTLDLLQLAFADRRAVGQLIGTLGYRHLVLLPAPGLPAAGPCVETGCARGWPARAIRPGGSPIGEGGTADGVGPVSSEARSGGVARTETCNRSSHLNRTAAVNWKDKSM